MGARWIAALLSLSACAGGCGLGQFQTARTEPVGKVRFTMAQMVLFNENQDEQDTPFFLRLPQQIEMRVGVGERVDLGLAVFLLAGGVLDVKVNLMPPEHDFALALRLGFGGAADTMGTEDDGATTPWLLHLPVSVIASYRFLGCLSPYVGLGYGFYWIFDRSLSFDPEEENPGSHPAEREGYGDGVLRLTVGLEWMLNPRLGFLLEYSYLAAVVDDPGDNFAFVDNHLVGLGLRF